MTKKLFGTDGIRGRAFEYPMTEQIAFSLGYALASNSKKILIGKDTRESCDAFEQAVASGCLSYSKDIKIISLGVLPTPAVAFYCQELRADFGIMISASHNSYEDNGLKVFNSEGYKLTDKQELRLEEKILAANSSLISAFSHWEKKKISSDNYVDHLVKIFENKFNKNHDLNLNILLDTANGSSSEIAQKLFGKLDFKFKIINDQPNGKNINLNCGALYAQNLKNYKFDLGFAYDGDADRLIVVDGEGEVVSGDIIMALLAEYLGVKKIATTVMINFGLEKYLKNKCVEVVKTQVGDRYVIEALREHDLMLGGEDSGHIILKQYSTTGDGLLASLFVILAVMDLESRNLKLSDYCREFELYPRALLSFLVPNKKDLESLGKTQNLIKTLEKKLENNGRILVRYSGTENKARVLVEGQEQDLVDGYAEQIKTSLLEELS